jgi:hypothetical protein
MMNMELDIKSLGEANFWMKNHPKKWKNNERSSKMTLKEIEEEDMAKKEITTWSRQKKWEWGSNAKWRSIGNASRSKKTLDKKELEFKSDKYQIEIRYDENGLRNYTEIEIMKRLMQEKEKIQPLRRIKKLHLGQWWMVVWW